MKKKPMVHSNIGPVIVDFIEELEIQLDQELCSYYNTNSPKSRSALPATAPTKLLKAISDEKADTMTKSTSADITSINKAKAPTPSKINVQVIIIYNYIRKIDPSSLKLMIIQLAVIIYITIIQAEHQVMII